MLRWTQHYPTRGRSIAGWNVYHITASVVIGHMSIAQQGTGSILQTFDSINISDKLDYRYMYEMVVVLVNTGLSSGGINPKTLNPKSPSIESIDTSSS